MEEMVVVEDVVLADEAHLSAADAPELDPHARPRAAAAGW
jgi:hypothetical protein